MTEQTLRIIEARLEAAESLYTTLRTQDRAEQAACCLDWTRAVGMPDMRLLVAEVRRLHIEAEAMRTRIYDLDTWVDRSQNWVVDSGGSSAGTAND